MASHPGGPAASASSSFNWKTPSAQHMLKYGLVPLPEDFEPTPEEASLLEMYEVVKTHERLAGRLREEQARAKLAAKDKEFQQKIAPPKKKKRRVKREKVLDDIEDDDGEDDDGEDMDDDEEVSDDEGDDDDEEDTLQDRREAKIAALREEVQEAKQAQEKSKESLRNEYLATANDNDDMDEGLALRRKQRMDTEEPASSLIANLTANATPPHDFSKKYTLSALGTVLFPRSKEESRWEPPEGVFSPNEGSFIATMPAFDVTKAQNGSGNNTLAIKFMAPSDAKRFSMNICLPNHGDDFDSVLFHFNPRQFERGGQLVVNDKQTGVWGQAIAIPLSQVPLLFGQMACTLMIQIHGDGFDIFLEDKHCARLEHRFELPSGETDLILQFPSTDDYGSPENWIVYKIWWGNRPIMAKGDISGVAGVNSYNSMHPRKLFLSGLAKIYGESQVDIRRAELERAFRKYGGAQGVTVVVPTNSTYAFVEVETERMADLALAEMANKYRINRARRSRHEALQEERAAKEAAKSGEKKDGAGWD